MCSLDRDGNEYTRGADVSPRAAEEAGDNSQLSAFQQPTAEQLASFRSGDPLTIDEVIRLVLPQLHRWALAQYRELDSAEVESTLNQVLAETCIHHERYDPRRSAFTTYVIRLLKLRLNDVYRFSRREPGRRETFVTNREKVAEEPYTEVDTIDHDARIVRQEFFNRLEEQLTDDERAILQLMLAGHKDTESFVAVLRRGRRIEDPEREVKNAKERLLRKVRRVGQDLGFDAEDLL